MGKITTLSPEELAMIEKTPGEEVIEAAEKSGDPAIIERVKQYVSMAEGMDTMTRGWMTEALSVIYKRCGADAVQEAWMNFALPAFAPGAESFWTMNFHDRVLSTINGLRYSTGGGISVLDEDDEKLTFAFKYCQTGQKLMDSGIYEGTSVRCSPHPVTAGLDNFPIYCTHNPVFDIARAQLCDGYIQYATEFPENVASCGCKMHIYKNKDDIPEEYYTRVGLKKPE